MISAFFLLSLLLVSCGGGNGAANIAPAFEAAKNHEEVSKVVELLTQEDIDCDNLSAEEYAKLGLCILYVAGNDQTPKKEELKKLKTLCNNYDKAGSKMTEQQLREAKECAEKLLAETNQSAPAQPDSSQPEPTQPENNQ